MVTITLAAARQRVFQTVFRLINNNKTSGWNVLAAFNEELPDYPQVVVESVEVESNVEGFGFDKELVEREVLQAIHVYDLEANGPSSPDLMVDTIVNIVEDNESSIRNDGLLYYGCSDSDVGRIVERKLLTRTLLLRFKI